MTRDIAKFPSFVGPLTMRGASQMSVNLSFWSIKSAMLIEGSFLRPIDGNPPFFGIKHIPQCLGLSIDLRANLNHEQSLAMAYLTS